MKNILAIGFMIWFAVCSETVFGQAIANKERVLRIGFYNSENYFDPYVDSTVNYHEFEPDGNHHWTPARYRIKRQHVFKVITAMGGWHGMDIMAFAEIENRFVLEDLLKNTPLGTEKYGIIHFDSPDHRGIDVGLIYRKSGFHPFYARPVPVRSAKDHDLRTRDILYVKGRVGRDTLQLFINHWPSRYGGLMATVSKRLLAARILRRVVDSVCKRDHNAHILILGDFNETITDKGLQWVLHADTTCAIIALPPHFDNGLVKGTIRSTSGWTIFDRILCSKNLVTENSRILVVDKSFHIFDAPFLMENDEKNMGLKPFRTYQGFKWQGGFSDHLPVYVDIAFQKPAKP